MRGPLPAAVVLALLLAGCTVPPDPPLPTNPPGYGTGGSGGGGSGGGTGGTGGGSGGGSGGGGSPSPAPPVAPLPEGWPQFGLDVAGSRHASRETAIAPASVERLQVAWRHPVGGAVTGTPAVADGRVFFGSWDKHLYAVDARTGDRLWAAPTAGGVDASPAVAGGKVYVGDGAGFLYRFDAATGKEEWRAALDPEPGTHLYGSPLVHGGVVYIGVASDQHSVRLYPEPKPLTFRGSVVAVDAGDGRLRWRSMVQPPDGGLGGSVWGTPVLDPRTMTLYVGTGNAYTAPAGNRTDALLALDARTGADRWVFQATKDDVWTQRKPNAPDWDFGASPTLAQAGGRTLVIAPQKSGVVWARDAATGKPVWQHGQAKGGSDITASPAVMDGTVFVASQGGHHVRALEVATGKLRWQRDTEVPLYSSPAAVPGLVLVGTSAGALLALDPATGDVRWRGDSGHGGIFGGLSVVDGTLYHGATPKGFLGDQGFLVAWRVDRS